MSKSKLSLEDSITLAQKNATDFTHACVTIALNEKFGIGKERQKKVNAVRDEVNGKVLEIMTRPASRKHEPLRKAEAWMHSQMPEGTVWELAERTGVKTQTAKKWTEPGGTRKITVERLRQITEILDGGALITEDGVEFELYGGKV